jgi:hypothetical protein
LWQTIANHPSGLSSSDISQRLELRLIHHYAISTYDQLPDSHDPRVKRVWAVDLPQLAFHSDLVLSALLGLSALHLWSFTPNDRVLRDAAEYYFDKALRKHRIALIHADKDSAEPLLVTAILIAHHTWLASHYYVPNEPYTTSLRTYYMVRGIQTLCDQMRPWLTGSGFLWSSFLCAIEQEPTIGLGCAASHNHFLDSSEHDLAELSKTFKRPNVSAVDKAVYDAAVAEVASMCSVIMTGAPQHWLQRQVGSMWLRVPPRFMELLEQKEPQALALQARASALLKVINPTWWLHGAGEYKVAEYIIFKIRDIMPPEWLWTMEWPLKVVTQQTR